MAAVDCGKHLYATRRDQHLTSGPRRRSSAGMYLFSLIVQACTMIPAFCLASVPVSSREK